MDNELDFPQLFIQHFIHFWNKFKDFTWLSWIWTGAIGVFGWYLNQIGYNSKPIVSLILFLIISDFITRILAEVINAGSLYKAFSDKKTISSKKFGVGFFVKFFGYTFVLTTAYKLDLTNVLYGLNFIISNFLYGGIVLYDIISNLENLRDAGFKPAEILLTRMKKEKEKFESGDNTIIDNNVLKENDENPNARQSTI